MLLILIFATIYKNMEKETHFFAGITENIFGQTLMGYKFKIPNVKPACWQAGLNKEIREFM